MVALEDMSCWWLNGSWTSGIREERWLRHITSSNSWMSFDDKLFDKMNVQFILQNVSLFSVWILNPRSFFKIHWNDDEFYFAFFFSFLLYNVTIDGRLMKFGHFFELCTARPLNGNCSARRHVSSYRSTSRNDLHRLRRWKCLVCASIRGTRSRHRDWRRSFLLSQSLVIIKMFISVWSFSFMQMQRTTMTTPDGCFAFDERKKGQGNSAPYKLFNYYTTDAV